MGSDFRFMDSSVGNRKIKKSIYTINVLSLYFVYKPFICGAVYTPPVDGKNTIMRQTHRLNLTTLKLDVNGVCLLLCSISPFQMLL